MVGVVRDIVIPVKGGGGEPVFTIVCQVLPVPPPPALQEESQPLAHLWKVPKQGRVSEFLHLCLCVSVCWENLIGRMWIVFTVT